MMEVPVFEASVSQINGIPVIELRGEINGLAQTLLDQAYDDAQSSGASVVLLNFQKVDYINSTGIALIVSLLSRAKSSQMNLMACGLSHHYQQIFEITRLSQFIRIYPDVYTALSEINRDSSN